MGNVCSAGVGQAPARQAALQAGLPESCTCTTVNKVCASGLKAITMGAQDIALGIADVVVAGGMENMSSVPYYVGQARFGMRMGDARLVDGMIKDGLWDSLHDKHMGLFAERCAEMHGFSRAEQDAHAEQSYRKAVAAGADGKFENEIAPVSVGSGKGHTVVREDEEYGKANLDRLPSLRPAFIKDGSGTVTSGNASSLNDGAACVVLMRGSKARAMGIPPLATIIGYADAERAPEDFTIAPALSVPRALARAKVALRDVDLIELNEAFSVVALANAKILGLDDARVNIFGGAVALGHPLGTSGARIVVTLLNALADRGARTGVAAICNGGGGSTALVLDRGPDFAKL